MANSSRDRARGFVVEVRVPTGSGTALTASAWRRTLDRLASVQRGVPLLLGMPSVATETDSEGSEVLLLRWVSIDASDPDDAKTQVIGILSEIAQGSLRLPSSELLNFRAYTESD